eukprot:5075361-Prymnesium_polylepis.3
MRVREHACCALIDRSANQKAATESHSAAGCAPLLSPSTLPSSGLYAITIIDSACPTTCQPCGDWDQHSARKKA